MPGLTHLQQRLVRTVLGVTKPHGFALGGAAGLIAVGLSTRPTDDLNAVTCSVDDVRQAADAVAAACEADELIVIRDHTFPSFVRLVATAGEARRRRQVRIDLAREIIEWPPVETRLGAVLSPRELAANKALALHNRVKPVDLCDIAILSMQFDLEQIMRDAKLKDPSFWRPVAAEMIRMILDQPHGLWPDGFDIATVRGFGQRLVKALEDGDALHDLRADHSIWG
jgi:hypothetical protein